MLLEKYKRVRDRNNLDHSLLHIYIHSDIIENYRLQMCITSSVTMLRNAYMCQWDIDDISWQPLRKASGVISSARHIHPLCQLLLIRAHWPRAHVIYREPTLLRERSYLKNYSTVNKAEWDVSRNEFRGKYDARTYIIWYTFI